jgi:hypothetical protein
MKHGTTQGSEVLLVDVLIPFKNRYKLLTRRARKGSKRHSLAINCGRMNNEEQKK